MTAKSDERTADLMRMHVLAAVAKIDAGLNSYRIHPSIADLRDALLDVRSRLMQGLEAK